MLEEVTYHDAADGGGDIPGEMRVHPHPREAEASQDTL